MLIHFIYVEKSLQDDYNQSMNISESEEILKSIKNADGIIIRWPKKKEEKRAVLEYLITKFESGKKYSELEVNMILKRWHSFGDHSLLRRELYDAFLFDRTQDCHEYWVHEE